MGLDAKGSHGTGRIAKRWNELKRMGRDRPESNGRIRTG